MDKCHKMITIKKFFFNSNDEDAMSQKFLLSFPMLVVLFQVSCGPTQLSIHDSNTVNGPVYGHESNTVYGVDMLGQPRSFTRGGITSARDVQIEWEDSAKEGGERLIRSSATEFVVEPDVGEPFLFVQYNEEQLKAGERVLLLEETGKLKIVRDRKDFFDKVATREKANEE